MWEHLNHCARDILMSNHLFYALHGGEAPCVENTNVVLKSNYMLESNYINGPALAYLT